MITIESLEFKYEDGTKEKVNKNNIVNLVQVEKDGRLTYIRYRD